MKAQLHFFDEHMHIVDNAGMCEGWLDREVACQAVLDLASTDLRLKKIATLLHNCV